MYGHGIIRNLIHQTVEICHLEISGKEIIIVFKNHNKELIKTVWQNVKLEENILELAKDPKFIFFERINNTVIFEYAHFLPSRSQKIQSISERDYRWCEFNYCDTHLDDDFLSELTQSGKMYLEFERYLEKNKSQNKDVENIKLD